MNAQGRIRFYESGLPEKLLPHAGALLKQRAVLMPLET